MLNDLLIEYTKRFGENFPIFAVRAKPEQEIISILETCLSEGIPYESDLNPLDALY